MSLLIISLAALVVGPLLYGMADRARGALAALDGFVMIAVAGLVLVHLIPHSFAAAGPLALVLALVGLFGPGLIEHRLRRAARQAHAATLVVALVGLVVHSFMDGVALGAPRLAVSGALVAASGASVLAIAVAIHRLPVAIAVWSILRPSVGAAATVATLVALGVATLSGYLLGDTASHLLSATWLALFQSLVAGSLLHVVVHRPSIPPARALLERAMAGAGALLGLAMVIALADTHLPLKITGTLGFASAYMTLALETAPALLLAFALAGLLQVFLPHASLDWMRTGRPLSESLRGVTFGLPLPICSCGVIPLYRTLVLQGAPATAAMAFLVATPELGLDAILISLPLLGAELTVARVVCAGIVAVAAGWVVGRVAMRSGGAAAPARDKPLATLRGDLWGRFRAGLRFGFEEIVDHVGPWLIVGLALAALAEPLLGKEWLRGLPFGTDVLLFTLLGMPSYVCASGATPLAAVLIYKGVSPGAALAFLLTGPATNVTTFGVLRSLHGARVAALFGAVIAALSIGLGTLANLLLPHSGGLSLKEAATHEASLLESLSLLALTAIFALSILRQGPRGFVGQVLWPYESEDPAAAAKDRCGDCP